MQTSSLLPMLACCAGLSVPMALASVTIIDDSFDSGSGDYSGSEILALDPLNYSYMSYDNGPSGETMLIDHIHDVERDEEGFPPVEGAPEFPDLNSLFIYAPVSYIPTVSGEIATLDFRIDYRTTDPFDDIFFHVRNGAGFGALAGSTVPNSDGEWNTLEVLGLTSADFLDIGFDGSQTLKFGFGFYSSAFVDPEGTEPVIYQIEVDNFSVTVNPVPEPGSALMLAVGTALLASRRGRNAAA